MKGPYLSLLIEELIPILLKLFHTTETDGTLPNSVYEASIALMPNHRKALLRKRITEQSQSGTLMQKYF